MALLDLQSATSGASLSYGPAVLRKPQLSFYHAWRDLRAMSWTHLTQWEPSWREEDLSIEAYKELLRGYQRAARRGAAAPYFIFSRADRSLVGGVNLINITRGASQSATLGYWVGAAFVRQGYAFAAVEAVVRHAFDTLGLNRLEAACQPGNVASRRLLEKAGFVEEGLARSYLYINGDWRDHLIYARLSAPPAR